MSLSKIVSSHDSVALERWKSKPVNRASGQQHNMLTASQLEALQNQAKDEGYQAGYQEGLDKGEVEIKQKVKKIEKIISMLSVPLELLDDTVEKELTTLSLIIARQIIRRELKTDPDHVVAVVKEAVSALPLASRNIRIILHPEDAVLIKENLSLNEDVGNWSVVDDPALTRGDCKVSTETSHIDATIEKRLTAIAAELLGGEREGEKHG
ncbi:MAG: flagellar assembly protein FliH [Gammaproteobacteria bacterium]|nr:flagellar assembly protein FliH [Gammaproteobacteria bacterium]